MLREKISTKEKIVQFCFLFGYINKKIIFNNPFIG